MENTPHLTRFYTDNDRWGSKHATPDFIDEDERFFVTSKEHSFERTNDERSKSLGVDAAKNFDQAHSDGFSRGRASLPNVSRMSIPSKKLRFDNQVNEGKGIDVNQTTVGDL